MTRLKVLVSAYACSPSRGSEPGVGWGFVAELSKHHDLWVIVEEDEFRDELLRFIEGYPGYGNSLRFIFVKRYQIKWLEKIWPPSYYWTYAHWHRRAYKVANQLQSEVSFDVVHQLTMVGFREPGYLWKLGIPFVWGPVGGMGYFPYRFLSSVGLKGAIYYAAYNCINFLHSYFLQRPHQAAIRAGKGLITATPEN